MTEQPTDFAIVEPSGAKSPLVAHVPHASTSIPTAVREELLVTDAVLDDELLRLTDHYTDQLFAGLGALGATLFVNQRSRLVFDPERFLDDAAEPTSAWGQGVVYTHGSRGQPLRQPDPALRDRRIEELYRPYHAALDAMVAAAIASFGACTLIDCHSFPSTPLPSEADQAPDRPDFCIGTDAVHTPPDLAGQLEASFIEQGYRVERDRPYAGTFVPSGYYHTDARVHSVMIEVRRGLYMDEASGQRSARFEEVGLAISRAVEAALQR
jgi:N-formylglutamate amidohydrolase